MRYVSIDLETTGLDPRNDQILQIAAVVEDTQKAYLELEELPRFVCFVKRERYFGQAFALQLNSWIFKILAGVQKTEYPILFPDAARNKLLEFFKAHFGDEKVVVAGKNAAGFDIPFLRNLEYDDEAAPLPFHHRTIDPGSMFIDWSKKTPPALYELTGKQVSHDALEDALDVITVLRKGYAK